MTQKLVKKLTSSTTPNNQNTNSREKKAKPNAFSKIFDAINAFDDLGILDDMNSLSGSFKLTRRTNKNLVSRVKGRLVFEDPIFLGKGLKRLKKITYKDNTEKSFFGKFGDDDLIGAPGNPRVVKSGTKKFDYLYNGINSDILNNDRFKNGNKKLAEVSILPKYLDKFESDRATFQGIFRVNLDSNFIALSLGKGNKFTKRMLLRADFESDFDFLNPEIEVSA